MLGRIAFAVALALAFPAGASAASLTVTASPARLFYWSKLDVAGSADPGTTDLYAWMNRGAACGATLADQEGLAARSSRSVSFLGDRQLTGGAFDLKVAWFFTNFGVDQQVCAYLYPEACDGSNHCGVNDGDPPAAQASPTLRAQFALAPWFRGPFGYTMSVPGFEPRARARTLNFAGTCGGRSPYAVRRWYVPHVRVRADASFTYSGRAIPDNSNGYHGSPPKLPAAPHVRFSGRFFSRGAQTYETSKVAVSVRGINCHGRGLKTVRSYPQPRPRPPAPETIA